MGSLDFRKKARLKRKRRIRKALSGTNERPRLTVFRSARHIYAQIINDVNGQTVVSASSMEKAVKAQDRFESKVKAADYIGKLIGERAIEKGIKKVVFDRNGYMYHGRVKAVSDGAREAGLEF
ncbi:MAG: 50S ribosomal protein L18 [Desulfobacteraceae bacterium 4572_123]|nr:MAG: 50S ribosomal protein L18 [Desulfobacteraceae bacterium 4572_123]